MSKDFETEEKYIHFLRKHKKIRERSKTFSSFAIHFSVGFTILFTMVYYATFIYKSNLLDALSKDVRLEYKMNIAIIDINEVITIDYINKVIKQLDQLKEQKDKVGALLVVVNSPGGSPAGSDELANYLLEFKKEIPVYMYIQSCAASGAYYIASAVKPIAANPNAIVGSIGVIMAKMDLEDLARELGVGEERIASGKFKAVTSLFKRWKEEYRNYFKENMIDPAYVTFLNFVAKNRGIDIEKMRQYADGKIYLAGMPEVRGILVDELSNITLFKQRVKTEVRKKHSLLLEDVGFTDLIIPKEKSWLPFKVSISLNSKQLLDAVPQVQY